MVSTYAWCIVAPIAPVKSRRLRIQTHRERLHTALNCGVQYVGYVSDEGIRGEWYNTDEVLNQWNQGQMHYECQHKERFVVGSV